MKKYVAICATLAALAWVGVAAADTPQGKLTGSAPVIGLGTVAITTPILDGGTSYVGRENDKSGNCTGDSGAVTLGGVEETIVCAHFVASSRDGSGPKMRFAALDPESNGDCYFVFRISDGGSTDKFGVNLGAICDPGALALAEAIVNEGFIGGSGVNDWVISTLDGYTITASQT
jgi:hypothetical protein